MAFIYPMLLGGLAAVGLPVLLHLLMRQKPKHLLFPAFRFLQQRAKTNQRKLRLRHLLLLLLRMSLLALICLALARPRIFSDRLGFGQNQAVAAVLIVDTSPSMDYAVAGKSRLEEAKQRALELLDEMNEASRVAVVDTGDPTREWGSISQAKDKVRALTIRPGSTPVTSAIAAAYQMFAGQPTEATAGEEAVPRMLYILTDRTVASWDAGRVPDLQGQRDRLPPPAVTALIVDVGVEKPVDVAIAQAEVKPQSVPASKEVVVAVTVTATGQGCDTEVMCRIVGENVVERKSVKLDAGQSEVLEFIGRTMKPGQYQAEITLATADGLMADNARYVTFEVRGGRKLLTITDDANLAAAWQLAFDVIKNFECEIAESVHGLDELRPYAAVCLMSVRGPDDALWATLTNYVQQGGHLIVVPGRDRTQPEAYQSAAAMALLPGRIEKAIAIDDGPLAQWEALNRKHPLLGKFAGWKDQDDVGFLRSPRSARRYWAIKPLAAENVIVGYNVKDKHPAILERVSGRAKGIGRVLMLSSPLDYVPDPNAEEWNDYQKTVVNDGFYVVLANELMGYVVGDLEESFFNFASGQPVTVPVPPFARFPEYALDGPGVVGSDTRVPRKEEEAELAIRQTSVTGNFTVVGGNAAWKSRFSLNPPGGEFQLDRVAVPDVETLLGKDCVVAPGQNRPLSEALNNRSKQPVELFPWLMLLFAGLIVVESIMANRFYKPEEKEGQ